MLSLNKPLHDDNGKAKTCQFNFYLQTKFFFFFLYNKKGYFWIF